jgi:hypothetical protein
MKTRTSIALVLLCACAGAQVGSRESDVCPPHGLDTSDWRRAGRFALGVEFLLAAPYQEMIWEVRTDSSSVDVSYWRDRRPASRLNLRLVHADSTDRYTPARTPNARQCALTSASAAVTAVLQETVRHLPGGRTEPVFTIDVRYPTAARDTVVLLTGWARDSTALREMMASAQSVRRLKPPGQRPPS